MARWLRRRHERDISAGYDELLDLLEKTRAEAREQFSTSEVTGWDAALDDGLLDLVRSGRIEEARRQLRRHLALEDDASEVAR